MAANLKHSERLKSLVAPICADGVGDASGLLWCILARVGEDGDQHKVSSRWSLAKESVCKIVFSANPFITKRRVGLELEKWRREGEFSKWREKREKGGG